MSGQVTEWGDQPAVSSVNLTATNPDGSPQVILPALQGPGQAPVTVPGPTLVAAAAAAAAPQFATPETLAPGATVTLTKNADGTYTLGVPAGQSGQTGVTPQISASATALPAGQQSTVTVSGPAASPAMAFGLPSAASPVLTAGTTTTLAPGQPAAVTISTANPLAPVLSVSIPQGAVGATGGPGEPDLPGPPVAQGPFVYQGVYDATAGAPTIPTPAAGNVGWMWVISVAGTDLPGGTVLPTGVTAAAVGDALLSNGTTLALVHGMLSTQAVAALIAACAVQGATLALTAGGRLSVNPNAPGVMVWADQNGFIIGYIDSAGTLHIPDLNVLGTSDFTVLSGVTVTAGTTLIEDGNNPFALGDEQGYLAVYVDPNGVLRANQAAIGALTLQYQGVATDAAAGAVTTTTTAYSSDQIAQRNARALAVSQQITSQIDAVSARPVWTYNHILVYGQALSSGWEGWPALSIAPKYDTLMFGGSVRPLAEAATTWAPVISGETFVPLVEVNQVNGTTGTIVSAAAALAPGDFSLGETIISGAVNFYRHQQLNARGLLADPTRLLVASSCGVGGKTVAQLSKGASPELFNRLRTCASAVQAAAIAASGTYGVAALIYMQGENDYAPGSGITETTYAAYYAALNQLRSDFLNDIATVISGQAAAPAIFTYQTNEGYTQDDIAIGQAQLQLALDNASQGWYLAAPDYPVTDKGGHLDPNGYRWLGNQFGKVMHRVLTKGERWLPLYPTQITYRGQYVLVDFHVPEPPLVFDLPWVGSDTAPGTLGPATLSNQGFAVVDSMGIVPISSVTLVGDAVVQITLGRLLSTNPVLKYADLTHNGGNGGLRDSDPTVADDLYSYTAGSGQYAAADLTQLVGAPYPLWNWCVAFNMPIVAG